MSEKELRQMIIRLLIIVHIIVLVSILLTVSGCGYDHPPDVISIGTALGSAEPTMSGLPGVRSEMFYVGFTWLRKEKSKD